MTVTLTGREVFPTDGNPIIGADVYAYNASTNALVDQTTTDANGAWTMTVASLDVGYDVKVVYGWGIRWQYIAQKVQAQNIVIDGSVTVRDWAHSSSLTKIDGGDIYVGSLIEIASSGSIRSGQTAYNTGTGWWIGDVGGTPRASMGVSGGAGWTWDGTTFSVTGTITATVGTIGGFTLGATTISATGIRFGASATQPYIEMPQGLGEYIGDGFLVFYTVATGITVMRAGTYSAGALVKGIHWDGANLAWIGTNTSLTAAGLFTATNAAITGAITASSGSITGPLTMSGASSSIAIGTTPPPSSATVGTGLWLDRTGLYGLNANTQEFYVLASNGKAYFAGGNGWIDANGLVIKSVAGATSYFRFWDGVTAYPDARMWYDTTATNAGFELLNNGTGAVVSSVRLTGTGVNLTAGILSISGTGPLSLDGGRANIYSNPSPGTRMILFAEPIAPGNSSFATQTAGYIACAETTGAFTFTGPSFAFSGGNITLSTASATVDGVDVSAHTHGGAGQGGTVAVASVTGAAPLASPTFTGTVNLPGSGSWSSSVVVINVPTSGTYFQMTTTQGASTYRNWQIATNDDVAGAWNLKVSASDGAAPSINVITALSNGNVTIAGTLTVSGDQTGATDHVFDAYDDLELLQNWRAGKALPFATGDLLNRDRLLRDSVVGLHALIASLEAEVATLRARLN